ncbi:MAG: hypothetical protein RKP20_16270 [Candidatus Competibacter sp.]|nr:hypothetical protein [Candidatus Competibacter sp.]
MTPIIISSCLRTGARISALPFVQASIHFFQIVTEFLFVRE